MRAVRLRLLAIGGAWALALAAQPALAWTQGQLECPLKQAPAGLGKALVSQLVDSEEGSEVDQGVIAQLEAVSNTCAASEKVPADQKQAYDLYVINVVARTEQMVQLRAVGIRPELIDKAFDLGPGKTNREVTELTDADYNRLIDLLAEDGIDVMKLANRDLRLIGTYAAISAEFYRSGSKR